MAYIESYKSQNWLIPLSIRDMIPADHICFLVEEFIESLNFSNFDILYGGAGHPAYPPRILMKILVYGMLGRVRSSRKISGACRENFVFMYLGEKVKPDFHTVCRFRKENASFVKEAFKETITLAAKHDLADLSFIAIDGSVIKASANKKDSMKKAGLDILDKAIDKMIEEDITQDELDQQLFGDKEENLTNMDRQDIKEIVRKYRKTKDLNKIKDKITKAKKEINTTSKNGRISLTDSESRMMLNKKGNYELAYNVQFSVNKNQIILANDVCQDQNDIHQLIPQIKNIEQNVGTLASQTTITADCGYSDGKNIKFLDDKKLQGLIPNQTQACQITNREIKTKDDNYDYDWKTDEIIEKTGIRLQYHHTSQRIDKGKPRIEHVYKNKEHKILRRVQQHFKYRIKMKQKMETPEAKKTYSLRQITVEPVIGNIKHNLGFREFLLRGIQETKTELNLTSTAHNLQKIWNKIQQTKINQTL